MVHADPKLAGIPVWGMTVVGAEPDNVGLQWLRIPNGSNASMPDGTQYADVANAHNYVQGHGSSAETWRTIRPFGPSPWNVVELARAALMSTANTGVALVEVLARALGRKAIPSTFWARIRYRK